MCALPATAESRVPEKRKFNSEAYSANSDIPIYVMSGGLTKFISTTEGIPIYVYVERPKMVEYTSFSSIDGRFHMDVVQQRKTKPPVLLFV